MTELANEGGAPGMVACQLTLAAAAARPGETVTALLQVSCSQPEAVELQEVEIEFNGIERIDTSWVLPSYRRSAPPINDDKRKVQRYVVQSRLQAATQGTVSDLSLRRFVVRFTLPAWLPPTFRGTAVRYLYYLQAMVKYRPVRRATTDGLGAAGDARSNGVGPAAAAAAGTGVATRIPLHIWPSKAEAACERGALLLPGGGVGAALQSEDMPIKCWEIGPGTAVQDAVAHIVKLAGQAAAPSRPHSPGGRLLRGGGPAGAPPRTASSVGGGSEISHSAAEGEAGAGGEAEPLLPPQPPLHVLPKQPPEAGPPPTQASSGASTPHSRLAGRRPPLARPSLDQCLVAPRSPSQLAADSGSTLRSFALRIGDQPLVRVSLHPPLEGSLQPGSTLAGTLDFTPQPQPQPTQADGSAPPPPGPCCVQVLILLETEEVVEAAWRRPVQGGGGGAIRRVHDEQLEVTADTSVTHFLFSIPPDAAASFHTPLVQLRWLLRFQFTAAAAPSPGAPTADRSPLQGRLEQLTWALPVTVLPPPAS